MAHYYDKKPEGKFTETEVIFKVLGQVITIKSASGLFSREKIDRATKLLIEKSQVIDGQKILDLGCGWGPVGISIKILNPDSEVMMTDINERAVIVTRKNIKEKQLEIKVKKSNIFEKITENFDVILTNPPYAAGRKICYQFIEESFEHLNKKGSLQLVARHQKGGAMLEKKMSEIFGNVKTIAKQGGFRVYCSTKEN